MSQDEPGHPASRRSADETSAVDGNDQQRGRDGSGTGERSTLEGDRTERRGTTTATDADVGARLTGTAPPIGDRRERRVVDADDRGLRRPKTSAAAVFSLVFGLAALFCALTAVLSPLAVVFGLIGLVLGAAGLGRAKRPGVTGRGVAVGGLVTALLGLLLGAAVIIGFGVLINDEARLDQLQSRLDELRGDLPTGTEVREGVDRS